MDTGTYRYFLMTTKEGRIEAIDDDSLPYDKILDVENLGKLREMLNDKSEHRFIFKIDQDYLSRFNISPEMSNEDLMNIQSHFKRKINNQIPKEKIMQAVMRVRKVLNQGLNDVDLKDMEMYYSRNIFNICKVDDYIDYLHQAYEECKSMTISEIEKRRPMLYYRYMVMIEKEKVLRDDKLLKEYSRFSCFC